jgi:hypothetical protein
MFLEALIVSACFYGNGGSCNSALDGYIKYNKYDKQLDELNNNAKRQYPYMYYTVTVLGAAATQRHYNGIIYKEIGIDIDMSNNSNDKELVFWKHSF